MSLDRNFVGILDTAAAWYRLERELRSKNRFLPEGIEFLEEVVRDAEQFPLRLPKGQILYRARTLAPDDDGEGLVAYSMVGPPPPEKARGSRLNPVGQPHLYLALDEPTALAEIRPFKGALVRIASFELIRATDVLDFRREEAAGGAPSERLAYVGHMLARPTHQGDALAYLPTQFLGQLIRKRGHPGVTYDSLLRSGGTNVALFTDERVRWRASVIREVTGVNYGSAQRGEPRAAVPPEQIPAPEKP